MLVNKVSYKILGCWFL